MGSRQHSRWGRGPIPQPRARLAGGSSQELRGLDRFMGTRQVQGPSMGHCPDQWGPWPGTALLQHGWIWSPAQPGQCWTGTGGPGLSSCQPCARGRGVGEAPGGPAVAIKACQCIQGPDMHIW